MKNKKLLIPILVIIAGVAFVLIDTSNDTVEDVIYQQAAVDDTSPVKEMLGSVTDGNISVYLYIAEDERLGYATIKENSSLFNKYSLCTVENTTKDLLSDKNIIEQTYNEQGLDYSYLIVYEPENNILTYDGTDYQLKTFSYNNINIGVSLKNNLESEV